MMNFPAPASAPSDRTACADPLRLAVAAYLARFKGSSRKHTESDLRCFLTWCAGHGLDPLAARRPHLELYIRWMQEIRRFKPSTVSVASPWWQGSTGPASSMTCWNTHPPSTSADPRYRRSHQPSGSRTCSSRHFLLRPASHRTSATSRWSRCSDCSACVSSRPPGRTLPTLVKTTVIGCCACAAKAPRLSSSRCHPQSAAP